MSLRGTGGTRDTISGRRCPSCGSPLAGEHKPDRLHLHTYLIVNHVLARTTLRQLKLRKTPSKRSFTVSSGTSETAIETRMTGTR